MRNLIIISILAMLSGCGNNGDQSKPAATQPPAGPMVAENLSGLSTEQILQKKYSKLELRCHYTQTERFASAQHADKVVDLMKPISLDGRKIVQEFFGQGLRSKISLRISRMAIVQHLDFLAPDGHRYLLQYSPMLRLFWSQKVLPSRGKLNRDGRAISEGSIALVEKIPTLIFEFGDRTEQRDRQTGYSISTRCTLFSEARPGYEKQFEVIR